MKLICSLMLTLLFAHADAATGRKLVFSLNNPMPVDTDTLVKKQSLSLGITAGSDASYFGRTSPKRYRYYTGDAVFNLKNGVFAYGTIWKVSGSYPTLDELDLGAGYLYHITKNLSGTASYSHFFFNRSTQIIKSLSNNDINVKNTYNWGPFKTSIAFDYLWGRANDVFMTPSISRYYETPFGIFDQKDYLSFTPSFSVIFGTQNFVERFSADERADPDPSTNYGHDIDNLNSANGNRLFKVMNYSFRIPIAYNRAHYTIEANTRFSIPLNVEGQLKNHREVFFNLTFYYLFY